MKLRHRSLKVSLGTEDGEGYKLPKRYHDKGLRLLNPSGEQRVGGMLLAVLSRVSESAGPQEQFQGQKGFWEADKVIAIAALSQNPKGCNLRVIDT